MSSAKKKLVLAYYLYKKQQLQNKKKKLWVHPILLERESYGVFHTLMEDLKKDERKFYNFFRMTHDSFRKLLELVYDQLRHADTNMRLAITPAERLAVNLRYVCIILIF